VRDNTPDFRNSTAKLLVNSVSSIMEFNRTSAVELIVRPLIPPLGGGERLSVSCDEQTSVSSRLGCGWRIVGEMQCVKKS
jgi:hypothetical protein